MRHITRPALAAAILLALGACAAGPGGGGQSGQSAQAGQQAAARSADGVFRQKGEASFFRAGEGGNTVTASGDPVDPQGLTAAHRTLPFGTIATVTSPATGKSVQVRINDRGPERTDRVIDISERAAAELGIEALGVAPVVVEADPDKQKDPGVRQALASLSGEG